MRYAALALITAMLTACGQQFRYPCQNPENWDRAECKRPLCEVHRDCPDHIFKEDREIKLPPAVPAPAAPRGECR